MTTKRILLIIFISICMLVSFLGTVNAAYPEEPITMIVTYSAGGGTDIMARTLFPYVEERLEVPVVIENYPGAGGELGITEMAQSEPDGYTISNFNTGQIAMELTRDTQFKIKEDITPLAQIVRDPTGLYTNADSEFETLEDVIEYARENPNVVSWGGRYPELSDYHFLTKSLLEDEAGIKFAFVPFDGSAESRAALLGGHIDLASGGISEFSPNVKEGKLRCLVLFNEKPHPLLPDAPIAPELGYDIITGATRGLAAPAGVTQERIDILVEAIKGAMEDEEFLADAEERGIASTLDLMTGEEYKNFIYNYHDATKRMLEAQQ